MQVDLGLFVAVSVVAGLGVVSWVVLLLAWLRRGSALRRRFKAPDRAYGGGGGGAGGATTGAVTPSHHSRIIDRDGDALKRTPSKRGPRTSTASKAKGSKIAKLTGEDVPDNVWEIDVDVLKFKTLIGSGTFGEVWLGTWFGTPVAVKTIPASLQEKPDVQKRFVDEIMLMSTLHHPNVALFLGACTKSPDLCLVLEYCAHGSMYDFLRSERVHGIRITHDRLLHFAMDIARGVHYLHRRRNVVQRDLKAKNVLIDDSLSAKVADFGLSRVIDVTDEDNTMTACGTPAWTAPEIIKNEAYNEKVDVYSYGIILWEMVTRKDPYGGQRGVQIAYAAAEHGLRPVVPENMDKPLARLMQECWAHKPANRPTFVEIVKRLYKMIQDREAVVGGRVPLAPLDMGVDRSSVGSFSHGAEEKSGPISSILSLGKRDPAKADDASGGGGGGGSGGRGGDDELPVEDVAA